MAGVWVFSDCALLALSLAIGYSSWPVMASWLDGATIKSLLGAGAIYVVLVALSIVAPLIATADIRHPIDHHLMRTGVLVVAVLVGAFPAFASLVLVSIRLGEDLSVQTNGVVESDQVAVAIRTRADIHHALTSLSSLVAGAVIATGAYGAALRTYGPQDQLPPVVSTGIRGLLHRHSRGRLHPDPSRVASRREGSAGPPLSASRTRKNHQGLDGRSCGVRIAAKPQRNRWSLAYDFSSGTCSSVRGAADHAVS